MNEKWYAFISHLVGVTFSKIHRFEGTKFYHGAILEKTHQHA